MSLQSAFSKFYVGDVITAGDYSYVVCREVHPVQIAKSVHRYALAYICGCNTHAEYVLPNSYGWDSRLQAFTTVDGVPLPGWTKNATVERNVYQNADLKFLSYAMTLEDRPVDWSGDLDVLSDMLLEKASKGALYASSIELKMLSTLKAIGLEATLTQAVILAKVRIDSSREKHEVMDLTALIDVLTASLSRPW